MQSCADALFTCWQPSLQSIVLIGGAAGGIAFALVTFAAALLLNRVERRRAARLRETGDRS